MSGDENIQLGKAGTYGSVNFNRIKGGLKKQDLQSKELIKFFDKFDTDHNGILNEDETQALVQEFKMFSEDGMITDKEARKILKNNNLKELDNKQLFEFLNLLDIHSEKIEKAFLTEINGVTVQALQYKTEGSENEVTEYYNTDDVTLFARETKTKVNDEQLVDLDILSPEGKLLRRESKVGEKSITIIFDENEEELSRVEHEGVETDYYERGQLIKTETDRGNGLKDITDVVYDENGKVVQTIHKFYDGTVRINKGRSFSITHPDGKFYRETNLPDGTSIMEDNNGITKLFPNKRELRITTEGNTRRGVLTETVYLVDDEPEDSYVERVEFEYDEEGNFYTYARNGETFSQTAKRIGIKKNTPEYEKFKELNPEAVQNGWFKVGAKVKIPAGMEDKVIIEELEVDPKSEKAIYQYNFEMDKQKKENREALSKTKFGQKYTEEYIAKEYPSSKYDVVHLVFDDLSESSYTWIEVTNKQTKEVMEIRFKVNGEASITTTDGTGRFKTIVDYQDGYSTIPGLPDIVESRKYDNDRLTEVITYNDTGSISSVKKYELDENGSNEIAEQKDIIDGVPIYTRGDKVEMTLANDLRRLICKKFPTDADRQKLVSYVMKRITKDNVKSLMTSYSQISNGESILAGILEERMISRQDRIKCLKHIKQAFIDNAKANNTYTKDVENKFDAEIMYQMKKFGLAEADYLEVFTDKLQKRIESEEIGLEEFIPPNGKIDEVFSQGTVGDCWLLASIKAIADTPKGLEILNNSLKVDKYGNVTVTLKGVNRTYLITKEELEGNTEFTSGDGDVRAIEIAIEKYFHEQRGSTKTGYELDLNGNNERIAFKILTGVKGSAHRLTKNDIKYFNKTNFAFSVSCSSKSSTIINSKSAIDNSNQEIKLLPHHSYSVSGADDTYVYLINPHDTSTPISVPIDEFLAFFEEIEYMEFT